MHRRTALITLTVILLTLTACGEGPPQVDWELTVDGDVENVVTFTFQEIVDMEWTRLTDIVTQNPQAPDERASWEGVRLLQLFRVAEGVTYDVNWHARVTLADGTVDSLSLADLRGAILALKDGEGNWLAKTNQAPLRLVAPNLPSDQWLAGPVRITVQAP